MSYRDPYSEHLAPGNSGRYPNNQPQYAEPVQDYSVSHPTHRAYDNMGEDAYNPYAQNPQTYSDERQDEHDYNYGANEQSYNNYPPMQRQPTQNSVPQRSRSAKGSAVVPIPKEGSGFERGEFTPTTPQLPRSHTPRALREYRYDHQGNLWTKGGRGRCVGRVCCCTLMTTVFLLVSIVLTLILWVRPPTINIGGVQTMTDGGSAIKQLSNGIQINLGVGISVANPNYFSVDLKDIKAEIFYPIQNTLVGGGEANDIVFKTNSQTNFTFPFSIIYNSTADPNGAIISDLALKCGVGGGAKTNLDVNYKITLGIRILLITISPVISNQFSFPCPLQPSDISKFLGGSTT